MDDSTESVIRLHGLEIREHEKRLNMLAMDLESLDYEEGMNYLEYLRNK